MVDVMAETEPSVAIDDAKKKRKKRCVENNNEIKMEVDSKVALLAGRKRAHSPRSSPPRSKAGKLAEEAGVDNETLIRETEAALKSLSGSWPGARASYYNHAEADDKFENLFDEKHVKGRAAGLAASPGLGLGHAGHGLGPDSLKDVITLRGQLDPRRPSLAHGPRPGLARSPRAVRRDDDDLDDSSQELHIDLDKGDERRDVKKAAMAVPGVPGFGPYPPRPTFVGFPGDGLTAEVGAPGMVVAGMDDKAPPSSLCLLELNLKFEEDDQPAPPPPAAASPDPASKQYTILQPAGAGSRAATAIQDVTREGVPAVPRAPFGPLSPVSINRGE